MFQGHCYQRQTQKKKYDEASADCSTKEAILAVPNTKAENEFLVTIMNPNKVPYTWIGFDYDNNELWEDGTSISITSDWRILYNVDDNHDRANGEPVVFMRPNGDWSFDSKSNEYQFVCEKLLGTLLEELCIHLY